jgi:hypothetical protein
VAAIDAAFAWPVDFVKLVQEAPAATHQAVFTLDSAIKNPYLYRQTERYIRNHVTQKDPLTAPGDKFGNNSSKAQALVSWFKTKLPLIYRPPFDSWQLGSAKDKRLSLIEVYPAASMKSSAFRKTQWPTDIQDMDSVGDTDIGDAKRCAMTAVCYAMTIGMLSQQPGYPTVVPPPTGKTTETDPVTLQREGWIFSPAKE